MNLLRMNMKTPLGILTLARGETGLAGAWFEGQRHLPASLADWPFNEQDLLLREAARQLDEYFSGRRTRFELPLEAAWGTPFQRAVWAALAALAPRETTSYGALAQTLGRPQAARAVGAAVGRNPWSVIVPCHRVLGSTGALTGYAGGLERKVSLLRLEGVLI